MGNSAKLAEPKGAPWPTSRGCSSPLGPVYRRRLQYRGLLFCRSPGSRCRDLIAGIGTAVVAVLLALLLAPTDAAPFPMS